MKSIRTTGILLVQIATMACACSSDNNPSAKSTATTSTGGSGNSINTGGSTAKSTTTTGTGGVTVSFNTGGTTAVLPDAGNSDAAADSAAPAVIPSIVGDYTDAYGEDNRITSDTWYLATSIFHIAIVDNVGKFLIAVADSKNQYSANLWNRFDWNVDGNNVLRYCETVYNASTEQEALDAPAANAQDFDKGCAGFPWSVLTPIQIGDAGADAGH